MGDDFDYGDVSFGTAVLAFFLVAALGACALVALDGVSYFISNM